MVAHTAWPQAIFEAVPPPGLAVGDGSISFVPQPWAADEEIAQQIANGETDEEELQREHPRTA